MDMKDEGGGLLKTKGKTGRGRDREGEEIDSASAEAFKGSSGGGGESPSISCSLSHLLLQQAATSLALLNILSAHPYRHVCVFIPCNAKYNHRVMPYFHYVWCCVGGLCSGYRSENPAAPASSRKSRACVYRNYNSVCHFRIFSISKILCLTALTSPTLSYFTYVSQISLRST